MWESRYTDQLRTEATFPGSVTVGARRSRGGALIAPRLSQRRVSVVARFRGDELRGDRRPRFAYHVVRPHSKGEVRCRRPNDLLNKGERNA